MDVSMHAAALIPFRSDCCVNPSVNLESSTCACAFCGPVLKAWGDYSGETTQGSQPPDVTEPLRRDLMKQLKLHDRRCDASVSTSAVRQRALGTDIQKQLSSLQFSDDPLSDDPALGEQNMKTLESVTKLQATLVAEQTTACREKQAAALARAALIAEAAAAVTSALVTARASVAHERKTAQLWEQAEFAIKERNLPSSSSAIDALKVLGAARSAPEPAGGASSKVQGKEGGLNAAVVLPNGGWSEFLPAPDEPAPGWGEGRSLDGGGADVFSGTCSDADPAASADKLAAKGRYCFAFGRTGVCNKKRCKYPHVPASKGKGGGGSQRNIDNLPAWFAAHGSPTSPEYLQRAPWASTLEKQALEDLNPLTSQALHANKAVPAPSSVPPAPVVGPALPGTSGSAPPQADSPRAPAPPWAAVPDVGELAGASLTDAGGGASSAAASGSENSDAMEEDPSLPAEGILLDLNSFPAPAPSVFWEDMGPGFSAASASAGAGEWVGGVGGDATKAGHLQGPALAPAVGPAEAAAAVGPKPAARGAGGGAGAGAGAGDGDRDGCVGGDNAVMEQPHGPALATAAGPATPAVVPTAVAAAGVPNPAARGTGGGAGAGDGDGDVGADGAEVEQPEGPALAPAMTSTVAAAAVGPQCSKPAAQGADTALPAGLTAVKAAAATAVGQAADSATAGPQRAVSVAVTAQPVAPAAGEVGFTAAPPGFIFPPWSSSGAVQSSLGPGVPAASDGAGGDEDGGVGGDSAEMGQPQGPALAPAVVPATAVAAVGPRPAALEASSAWTAAFTAGTVAAAPAVGPASDVPIAGPRQAVSGTEAAKPVAPAAGVVEPTAASPGVNFLPRLLSGVSRRGLSPGFAAVGDGAEDGCIAGGGAGAGDKDGGVGGAEAGQPQGPAFTPAMAPTAVAAAGVLNPAARGTGGGVGTGVEDGDVGGGDAEAGQPEGPALAPAAAPTVAAAAVGPQCSKPATPGADTALSAGLTAGKAAAATAVGPAADAVTAGPRRAASVTVAARPVAPSAGEVGFTAAPPGLGFPPRSFNGAVQSGLGHGVSAASDGAGGDEDGGVGGDSAEVGQPQGPALSPAVVPATAVVAVGPRLAALEADTALTAAFTAGAVAAASTVGLAADAAIAGSQHAAAVADTALRVTPAAAPAVTAMADAGAASPVPAAPLFEPPAAVPGADGLSAESRAAPPPSPASTPVDGPFSLPQAVTASAPKPTSAAREGTVSWNGCPTGVLESFGISPLYRNGGSSGRPSYARELHMQGMGDYFLRNSNTAGNACYVVINGRGGGIQLVQTWPEVLTLTSSNWVQFGLRSGAEGVFAVACFIHGHTADLALLMECLSRVLPNPNRETWASFCARPGFVPMTFPPLSKKQQKRRAGSSTSRLVGNAAFGPPVALPSDPRRKRALPPAAPTGLSPEQNRARVDRHGPDWTDTRAPSTDPAPFIPSSVWGWGLVNPLSSSSTPALSHHGEHSQVRIGPGYQPSAAAEAASALGAVGELVPLRGSPAALLGPGADAPRGREDGGVGGSPPSV